PHPWLLAKPSVVDQAGHQQRSCQGIPHGDLRPPRHGNSDKPLEPERYKTSKYWGDEVQAVMDATGLKRPVLVGWSYGGRVMADYLTTHGTAKLAGLNYVDVGQKSDPSFFGRICAISP